MVTCVSATTASAPWSRSCLTAARAVSTIGANFTSGPVLERWDVSGVRRPKNPIVRSPTLRVVVATRPGKTFPSVPRTLVPSQGNFDSATRCLRTSVPKSNSWFPTTERSSPMAFISSIICVPLVMPDIIDEAMRSPPSVVIAPGAAARSCLSRVMRGANPPFPSLGLSS